MARDFPSAAGELLDQAIASAFRSRRDDLAAVRNLNASLTTRTLVSASRELDKVRDLVSPDYDDDAVALAYLLRYHYSHVNLAWSMLAASGMGEMLSDRSTARGLQIIDVGAGSFAMLFGAVLFSAERVVAGRQPIEIDVISFEPARAMREVGEAVWSMFRGLSAFKRQHDIDMLQPLRTALQHIEHRHDPAEYAGVTLLPDAHRCLTAMHAIYQDPVQQYSLQKILEILHQDFAPHSGFLTCHVGHRERARRVSPFKSLYRDLKPQAKLEVEPGRTRSVGRMAGVERTGRYATPPQLAYAGWSRSQEDTSVLYWRNDDPPRTRH